MKGGETEEKIARSTDGVEEEASDGSPGRACVMQFLSKSESEPAATTTSASRTADEDDDDDDGGQRCL